MYVISRTCIEDEKDARLTSGCITDTAAGGTIERCYCQGNLCNSSVTNTPLSVVFILLVCALVKILCWERVFIPIICLESCFLLPMCVNSILLSFLAVFYIYVSFTKKNIPCCKKGLYTLISATYLLINGKQVCILQLSILYDTSLEYAQASISLNRLHSTAFEMVSQFI